MLDVTQKNFTQLHVSFPTTMTTDPYAVEIVKLVQDVNAHDVALLTLTSGTKYDGLLDGAPVLITWSNPRGAGKFSGYVYRVDPEYRPGAYAMKMIAVGMSYPLMNHGIDVWTDARASDVVKAVARKFRLGYDVEDHARIYPQISQAGESYWRLLSRLADETGYILRMDGSTLVFRSRDSLSTHFRPISPVFDFIDSNDSQLKMLGEITSFRPLIGQYNPELGVKRATRTAFGVDPKTGAVLTSTAAPSPLRASGEPLFEEFLVDRNANSAMEVLTATESELESNRFSRTALMESLGDPFLAPERVVYVRGVSQEFNGYWTVRRVEHHITDRDYRCSVRLGTDGLGDPQYLTGERVLPPAPSSAVAMINPHRPGALPWPYPDPVLNSSSTVVGTAGTPLSDFSWTAVATNWSD